jgi:hypothetical protein
MPGITLGGQRGQLVRLGNSGFSNAEPPHRHHRPRRRTKPRDECSPPHPSCLRVAVREQPTAAWGAWERVASRRGANLPPTFFAARAAGFDVVAPNSRRCRRVSQTQSRNSDAAGARSFRAVSGSNLMAPHHATSSPGWLRCRRSDLRRRPVQANLGPFRTAVDLIVSIPGIKSLGAHVIVSEIGIDMSRFPSAAHLISWSGICPRNDESAGRISVSTAGSLPVTKPLSATAAGRAKR